MEQKEKISIIVVHMILDHDMNRMSGLCDKAIREHTYNEYELIYVDNDSDINLADWLEPNADIYLKNKENLGNTIGWDQGISWATSDKIVLMDSDVIVEKDWDKEMIEKLEEPDVGMTFSYSIVGDELYKQEAGLFVEYKARRDGFLFAFKKELYNTCGPFMKDQPFKLGYYEDDDFEMEAMKLGKRLIGCPSSRAWHKGQGTTKKMWDEEMEEGIKANHEWFVNKWNDKFPYLEK